MAERVTAEDRLHRLLWLLPVAAKPGGALLSELARDLGVEPRALLRDIEEATARAFYLPPGEAEPFTILYESVDAGDIAVEVHTRQEFRRPARLTPGEALAVALGLRAMAVQTIGDRDAMLALATRFEREVAAPDVRDDAASAARGRARRRGSAGATGASDEGTSSGKGSGEGESRAPEGAATAGAHAAPHEADVEAVVMDATTRRRRCRIRYAKPGGAPGERIVEPYRLVHTHAWYLLARDVEQDAVRLFRIDRIAAVDIDDEASFDVPADFDPSAYLTESGRPLMQDGVEAVVRYTPPAARWVAEAEGADVDEDGAVRVTRRVADPAWLVRHVLAFGGAAEVLSPETARREVARAAGAVAAGSRR